MIGCLERATDGQVISVDEAHNARPRQQDRFIRQNPGYVYAGDDPITLEDPTGLSLLGTIVSVVNGCVEGAVTGGPTVGPAYLKIGEKILELDLPEGRLGGCVEGAGSSLLSTIGGLLQTWPR